MPPKKAPPQPRRRRRGTGSISIAADGTIRVRLPANLDPKREAHEFRPDQLAAAEAWLDRYLNPQPVAEVPVVRTVHDWSSEWWDTWVEPVKPPTTARKYLWALRFLEPEYPSDVLAVTSTALQRIVNALSASLEPDSVVAIIGVWRRMFARAVDDGKMVRNPAAGLAPPAPTKRSEARHITAEEVALLWPAIVGERFEAAYALCLGCGLRMGEILGLHWEHVDFNGRRIWVKWQFTNGVWRPTPKGRNPHWIPMPEEVAVALARHRIRQVPKEATLVLESPYKGARSKHEKRPRPWARDTVIGDLRKILARLGIASLTPHAGRHGLATHLMANGVPATVIAERLGNSPAVIFNTYGHVTDAGRQRADELVDAYLPSLESGDLGELGAAGG